jgi:hypothetical protein
MKKLLFLALIASTNLHAEEFFSVAPIKFQLEGVKVEERLEQTLKYPEGLLGRFKSEGAKMSDKKVSQNTMSFQATKTVMFISKTVFVNGVLDVTDDHKSCGQTQKGYKLVLNLDGSDQLVTDNIDRLEAIICAQTLTNQKISATVKGKIYKGNDYSRLVGPVAKGIIEDQLNPLLKALTEEVQSGKKN